MRYERTKSPAGGMWTLFFALLAVSELSAQTRIVLPEGSVIIDATSQMWAFFGEHRLPRK